jgi:hypothetical protein
LFWEGYVGWGRRGSKKVCEEKRGWKVDNEMEEEMNKRKFSRKF